MKYPIKFKSKTLRGRLKEIAPCDSCGCEEKKIYDEHTISGTLVQVPRCTFCGDQVNWKKTAGILKGLTLNNHD